MFKRVVDGFQAVVAVLTGLTVVLLVTVSPSVPSGVPPDLDVGADLFSANCASCHGANREGAIGPALVGEDALARFGDFDAVVKFVSIGVPGRMPGFETRLTPDEIHAVASFIWEGQKG